MDRLFAYGTLAPGKANEHILTEVCGDWHPATVRGRLVDEGWGADLGSPAIVPDAKADEVEGLVFASEELGALWQQLDAFEGDGYERVQVDASLRDGASVTVWVYRLRRKEE